MFLFQVKWFSTPKGQLWGFANTLLRTNVQLSPENHWDPRALCLKRYLTFFIEHMVLLSHWRIRKTTFECQRMLLASTPGPVLICSVLWNQTCDWLKWYCCDSTAAHWLENVAFNEQPIERWHTWGNRVRRGKHLMNCWLLLASSACLEAMVNTEVFV